MLPKRNRVSRKDFNALFEQGTAFHSPHLMLRIAGIQGSSESEFSFSASKKTVKAAAGRNRVRRRGYSALAGIWAAVRPGYRGAFVAKAGCDKLPFESLKGEVEGLLKKAGAFSGRG